MFFRRTVSGILLALLLIVLFVPVFNLRMVVHAAPALPDAEWNKTYGGADRDEASSVVQTSDGGYAIAGSTNSFGAGGADFWLVKTDSAGNMEWNKTYGGTNPESLYSVVQTGDGGYAIAGETQSFGEGLDFWLVKTDSNGNAQWNRTYGGTGAQQPFSGAIQTGDGGYAIAGSTNSFGAGGADFWLVKTDSAGNMEWNKTYGGTNHEIALSMIQTGYGGYAMVGVTGDPMWGPLDIWLVKTDSAGNMEWNKTYEESGFEYAYSVVQTGDGGYAIAGSTVCAGPQTDSLLIKTDSNGNAQWNRTYGGSDDDSADSLIQTSDGGYAIAGSTNSFGAGGADFWLVKTDSAGNMEWNKTYGGTNSDSASSVVQTVVDGKYTLAGDTYSYGAGGSDFWLIRAEGEEGSWMDDLYVKYYENTTALYNALKNGEVDITDISLTQAQMEEVFDDPNIQAAISPSKAIFEFDFNNNDTAPSYGDHKNPTAYKEFRQGIACLVNKDYIVNNICNYSYRIDTPIPRPLNDWWVDWNVSQYDSYGDLLGNYPYEYDPDLAADYFDLSGFVEGETINPYYNESFPSSAHYLRINPTTYEDIDPLIFYIRSDDPVRLEAGRILGDNLRMMGIPVNAIETDRSTCWTKVIEERDYHIYTGGWTTTSAPGYLDLYSSEHISPLDCNYPQFSNATYDAWVKTALSPPDLDLAKEAALICQEILVKEAVCAWLYSPSQVMGYRNIYEVVNQRGGLIDNQWTFLKARLPVNASRNAIYYGLLGPSSSLNVVTDYPLGVLGVNLVYDTLLSYCPYDNTPGNVFEERDRGGTMPWLAEDWELEKWQSPYNPAENLTKLTFYLRDSVKWHDGLYLNSTDVKFTIEYLKNLGMYGSAFYSLVSSVHHVTTPNAYTVVVYENVSNIWTLDSIGKLPILPKHIFQNISDVTGYTPGANEGHPANQTMIGSGPWKYVSHNSSGLHLTANREYFMQTPPEAEIDFRYDWEMGCWAVDTMDMTMAAEAFATTGINMPDQKWEPGCDLNGDCQIDVIDLYLTNIAVYYNTTWGKSARRSIVPPPTECAIYVEPLHSSVVVGENLTVYVKLKYLTKLSGLQFKLNFDNSKLEFLDLNLTSIFGEGSTIISKQEANQTKGYIWVSMSSTGSSLSGNTTLATITFNATKPSGSILHLCNTELAAYGAPGSTCQLMAHKTIDQEVIVGVATPTGTNVQVSPAENAKITFHNIAAEGVTTLKVTQPPSTEFVSVLCNDLETTASYTGDITIQFAYDSTGLSLEDEQSMKIWLWNETSLTWIDITIYVDTANNIIYGVTPHLSMFGITRSISLQGSMSTEGDITVSTPLSPPAGLIALKLKVLRYYEIKTTKEITSPITVRLEYDDTSIPPEEEAFTRIWVWNEVSMKWDDITTQVNTENNIIYGVTQHLSMFGITSFASTPSEIVVLDATFSKMIVSQGYNMTVNFIIKNLGDFSRTFDVVVYRNSTAIATYGVSELSPNGQMTLSFTLNTATWVIGNYAISTCSHVIGWVIVTIPGDVQGDFDVDLYDAVTLLARYGAKKVNPQYNAVCDIDGDGDIDLYDAVILLTHYGQKYLSTTYSKNKAPAFNSFSASFVSQPSGAPGAQSCPVSLTPSMSNNTPL
jgi:ABC-type transport system substrate-binding protein